MIEREWETTAIPGHRVKLQHGFWSGKVVIFVDGEKIFERERKFFDTGIEHRFQIEDVPCIVRILVSFFEFRYELWADGKLQ